MASVPVAISDLTAVCVCVCVCARGGVTLNLLSPV